ncbi:stalk domain-containing protein [Paenibacillus thailandensis]|uniref:Stalk domain-containing protein n=1 Tax=Paenibacillus thailandensis TaxID=393250 RepID=A0ABW5QTC0_9BACL
MMKKLSLASLIAILVLAVTIGSPAQAAGETNGKEQLVITKDSNQLLHNGSAYTSAKPAVVKDGVTYVALRSVSDRLSLQLKYDSAAKQYVLTNTTTEVRYAAGSSAYIVNGTSVNGTGTPYVWDGTLMVPLRSLVAPFQITMAAEGKQIKLSWSVKPSAKFSVGPAEIYAGQTEVIYTDLSESDTEIVDEQWTNKQTVFDEPGVYTVSRTVQDANGVWSDTYSVSVTVLKANEPPVARFTTDKDSYKMGEPVVYEDESTDDYGIAKTEWVNNQKGFFTPGEQTVTLKVTDKQGLTTEYSKTITIEDELMYNALDFNLLFTDIGEKFEIDSTSVLQLPLLSYTSTSGVPNTLIRANSPESIVEEGIYYEETAGGNVRFLLHNMNLRANPVNIYVVATNENATDASVTIGNVGIGGPSTYVSATGKSSVARYLSGEPQNKEIAIKAGESKVILNEISAATLQRGKVITAQADVKTTAPIKFTVVVLDKGKDVLTELPNLSVLPWDMKHDRGTFLNADKHITISEPIGDTASRMALADNNFDPYLTGVDATTGEKKTNGGNYGVNYYITLERVQPNTLIGLNPRGGHYGGTFLVNGEVVYTTNNSVVNSSTEVGVLYRTGNTEETVTIVFTPASGSNLPLNLIFEPMPERID